jgi:WD40 repeat protein
MKPPELQAGGALGFGRKLYIERRADRALDACFERGAFCHILAPRQIGKSSLRARCAARLKAEGWRVVQSDITTLGAFEGTELEWYFSLYSEICLQIGRAADPWDEWSARHEPPPLRFMRLVHDHVLAPHPEQRLALFLDEIDVAFTLKFCGELFRTLRALHDQRSSAPAWQRFSLCLLGVASPSELSGDAGNTPFNVGVALHLEDFSRAEMDGFRAALPQLSPTDADVLLDAVFVYTSGHPYMTQVVLVRYLEDRSLGGDQSVDRLVRELFLDRGIHGDINIQTARRYLLEYGTEDLRRKMLQILKRIYLTDRVPYDPDNAAQFRLILAGVVSRARSDASAPRDASGDSSRPVEHVRYRNRIFYEIFGDSFLDASIGHRPFQRKFNLWIEHNRDEQYLLTGKVLYESREWSTREGVALLPEEADYLTTSLLRDGEERLRTVNAESEVARSTAAVAQTAAAAAQTEASAARAAVVAALNTSRNAQRRFWRFMWLSAIVVLVALLFVVALIHERREQDTLNTESLAARDQAKRDADRDKTAAWNAAEQNVLLTQMHLSALNRDLLHGAVTVLRIGEKTEASVKDSATEQIVAEVRNSLAPTADLYLSSLLPLVEVHGHSAPLTDAQFDGHRVITASEDGEARIHDLDTARVQRFMVDNSQIFRGILRAEATSGRDFLWLGARSGRVVRWDLAGCDLTEDGEYVGRCQEQVVFDTLRTLRHIAVSGDGMRLLTVFGDKTAMIWSGESGEFPVFDKASVVVAEFVDWAGHSVVGSTVAKDDRSSEAPEAWLCQADKGGACEVRPMPGGMTPTQIRPRATGPGRPRDFLFVDPPQGAQVWRVDGAEGGRRLELLGVVSSDGTTFDRAAAKRTKPQIRSAGFCDDGKGAPRVIVGTNDNAARVWSVTAHLDDSPPGPAVAPLYPSSDAMAAVHCDSGGTNYLYARSNGSITICPVVLSEASRCKPFFINTPGLTLTNAEFVQIPTSVHDPSAGLKSGILATYTNGSARVFPIDAPLAIQEEQALGRLQGGVWGLRTRMTAGRQYIAAGSDAGMIQVWAGDTGDYESLVRCERAHTGEIWALEWSNDGQWLLSASVDSNVNAWALSDLHRRTCAPSKSVMGPNPIRTARFTPTSEIILGDEFGALVSWRLAKKEVLQLRFDAQCEIGRCAIRYLELHGKSVVTARADGKVEVGRYTTGQRGLTDSRLVFDPGQRSGTSVTDLAVRADGRVAFVTNHGEVHVFDVADGSTGTDAVYHVSAATSTGNPQVAFAPDGRWLIVGTAGTLYHIDLSAATSNARPVPITTDSGVEYHDLEFSSPNVPDALARLAAPALDGMVHMWTFAATTGKVAREATAIRHEGPVYTARFVPAESGAQLVTGAGDGSIKLWRLGAEYDLVSRLEELRERTLMCLDDEGELGLSAKNSSTGARCQRWVVAKQPSQAVAADKFVDRWWGAAAPVRAEMVQSKLPAKPCGRDTPNNWAEQAQRDTASQIECVTLVATQWAKHLRNRANQTPNKDLALGEIAKAWSVWTDSNVRLSKTLQRSYDCKLAELLIKDDYLKPRLLNQFIINHYRDIDRRIHNVLGHLDGRDIEEWEKACGNL